MTEMRILTVRQPWAWAIIHGGKNVENRVRNIAGSYRGPVAIHAAIGKTAELSPEQHRMLSELEGLEEYFEGEDIVGGAIIGLVDLDGVHHVHSCPGRTVVEEVTSNLARGYHALTCSPWAELRAWHLCLTNPRPLRTPIPFMGALGLRRLDTTTIDLIQKELT